MHYIRIHLDLVDLVDPVVVAAIGPDSNNIDSPLGYCTDSTDRSCCNSYSVHVGCSCYRVH